MYPLEIESLIPCLSTQWITHMEIIFIYLFLLPRGLNVMTHAISSFLVRSKCIKPYSIYKWTSTSIVVGSYGT